MNSLLSIVVLIFANLAFAGLAEDFDQIKDHGRNLEPIGSICEEIAQLRFAEKYPAPDYKVVTGIEYSDSERTLGELDVVVFNTKTNIVDVVAEVKCWKNAKSGLDKAKDQRARFLKNVKSSKALKFKWLDDPKLKLTKTQFNKVSQFYSIAQSGSMKSGYDFELPYTLKELMDLREDLLRCQDSGNCKKP